MTAKSAKPDRIADDEAKLKRELERGLASGVSKRSPEDIRQALRKAREAA
jgi:hypothetical protein